MPANPVKEKLPINVIDVRNGWRRKDKLIERILKKIEIKENKSILNPLDEENTFIIIILHKINGLHYYSVEFRL